jgi:hypothetical protein
MTSSVARAPHRRLAWLAAWLVLAALAHGCSSRGKCRTGEDASGIACSTLHARDQLEFGMSRSEAIDTLGSATVAPPWRTDLGDVPTSLSNPFDSQTIESVIGEQYEVVRFFVEVERGSKCPFLQGRVRFAPLVFFEDELVGWEWSYVRDLVGQPVGADQRSLIFGIFCNQVRADQTREPAD